MKKPKISLIILSWNTKKLLGECLDSLISQTGPDFETEIIIVDNHSQDGSPQFVNQRYPQVKLLKNKTNLGFAQGNNQGAQKATGDYLFFINSDTFFPPQSLGKIIAFALKNPRAVLSPQLVLPNRKLQQDYYPRFPSLWQMVFYYHPLLRPLAKFSPLKNKLFSPSSLKPFLVDQLPGAALFVPRQVWEEVGPLDSAFKFFFEDTDWCFRARQQGINQFVLPQVKVIHYGGASWQQKLNENKNAFYHQYFASLLLFTRKHYPSFLARLFYLAILANFFLTAKFKLLTTWLSGKNTQNQLWD